MNRLSECRINDQFSVKYLEGTVEQKRHLQNLGFVPATIISIINITNDNMIVQIFDSRIAINRETSECIYGIILKKEKNKKKNLLRFKRR